MRGDNDIVREFEGDLKCTTVNGRLEISAAQMRWYAYRKESRRGKLQRGSMSICIWKKKMSSCYSPQSGGTLD